MRARVATPARRDRLEPGNVSDDKPTGTQKRRFYIATFCIALAIDVVMSLADGLAYRPSLVGLAIMIGAVLYFVVSLIRDR
jgi:hypothetical protein